MFENKRLSREDKKRKRKMEAWRNNFERKVWGKEDRVGEDKL